MYIPNAWPPSIAVTRREYDLEGRLMETRPGPGPHSDGIGVANSIYATEAEEFDSITPFLKKNRREDIKRKGYFIQPGGACMELKKPEDPGPKFEGPSYQDSFGHNSQPGGPTQGPNGRPFVVGGR